MSKLASAVRLLVAMYHCKIINVTNCLQLVHQRVPMNTVAEEETERNHVVGILKANYITIDCMLVIFSAIVLLLTQHLLVLTNAIQLTAMLVTIQSAVAIHHKNVTREFAQARK